MRASLVLVSLVLAISSMTGYVVYANGGGGETGDRAMRAEGWTKLGERWVQGNTDRDVIEVGKSEGKFRKLILVVEHSALEMFNMDVEFLDGTHFSPETRFKFEEGVKSREIDLPGDARGIRRVSFKYGNVPGGGKSQIEVWGR